VKANLWSSCFLLTLIFALVTVSTIIPVQALCATGGNSYSFNGPFLCSKWTVTTFGSAWATGFSTVHIFPSTHSYFLAWHGAPAAVSVSAQLTTHIKTLSTSTMITVHFYLKDSAKLSTTNAVWLKQAYVNGVECYNADLSLDGTGWIGAQCVVGGLKKSTSYSFYIQLLIEPVFPTVPVTLYIDDLTISGGAFS
jgi:hypothetical protein